MGDEDKKKLEQKLWDIANELRGKMDADEFRDYILGFIFYKYLSEKMASYANKLLAEDGITYLSLDEDSADGAEYLDAIKDESVEKLGYFLKPSELFGEIAKRGNGDTDNFILEDLTQILNNIERSTMGHESEDDFEGLFDDLDLTSKKLGKTEQAKNTLIAKVLFHLDQINFDLDNIKSDVLGDAYEYLIGQFAMGAGKKGGEFYTPQQISKILAKIVTNGKTKLKSVYDPTCGSGSLLLRVAKEVDDVSNFYGQESIHTTYNLARMNMILHDVHYLKFDIKQEDTLEHPQHIDKRFEAIVANPPFSAHWSANPLHMSDDRFSQYGKLAPKTKADYAFVQHMIHQLDENGTMAVVLPHGVLFRGKAEGHIRKYLIEDKNYLDAVIGLPAGLFYGVTIPVCVLVFKKCREDSDNIIFIDASKEFEKVKAQNYLTDENVAKVVDTFKSRETIDKYSYLASLDEVKENDYNLNIPRYVDTFEEEEPVDLDAVSDELKAIDAQMLETDNTIARFCDELGITKPF
jgi:type I restriction enzyme M protein